MPIYGIPQVKKDLHKSMHVMKMNKDILMASEFDVTEKYANQSSIKLTQHPFHSTASSTLAKE